MTEKQVLKRTDIDLSKLNISSLAHLCRQATDRYFRQDVYDDRYCLELFRRAIEEKSEIAWQVILDQYESLVISWVQRHHSLPVADEDAEYFVNRAFDSFWSAFSRNPDKIKNFRDLKSLLQYLKLCTHTSVHAYVERRMPPRHIRHSEMPLDSIPESENTIIHLEENMVAGIVWQSVSAALKTEQEKVIAEDYLLHDMKPKEIYARHRDMFNNVGHVRRVKGNLMTRLRRNKQLVAILEAVD